MNISDIYPDVFSTICDNLPIEDVQRLGTTNKSMKEMSDDYLAHSTRKVTLHYKEYLKTKYNPRFHYTVIISEKLLQRMMTLSISEEQYASLFNGIHGVVVYNEGGRNFPSSIGDEDIERFYFLLENRPSSRKTLTSFSVKYRDPVYFRSTPSDIYYRFQLRNADPIFNIKKLEEKIMSIESDIPAEYFDSVEELKIAMDRVTVDQELKRFRNLKKLWITTKDNIGDRDFDLNFISTNEDVTNNAVDFQKIAKDHPFLETMRIDDVHCIENVHFISEMKNLRRLHICCINFRSNTSRNWMGYIVKNVIPHENLRILAEEGFGSELIIDLPQRTIKGSSSIIPFGEKPAKLVSIGMMKIDGFFGREELFSNPTGNDDFFDKLTKLSIMSQIKGDNITIANFGKNISQVSLSIKCGPEQGVEAIENARIERHLANIHFYNLRYGGNSSEIPDREIFEENSKSVAIVNEYEANSPHNFRRCRKTPSPSTTIDLRNLPIRSLAISVDYLNLWQSVRLLCNAELIEEFDVDLSHIKDLRNLGIESMTNLKKIRLSFRASIRDLRDFESFLPRSVTDFSFIRYYGSNSPSEMANLPAAALNLVSNRSNLLSLQIMFYSNIGRNDLPLFDFPSSYSLDPILEGLTNIKSITLGLHDLTFYEGKVKFRDMKSLKTLNIKNSLILFNDERGLYLPDLVMTTRNVFMNMLHHGSTVFFERMKDVMQIRLKPRNINNRTTVEWFPSVHEDLLREFLEAMGALPFDTRHSMISFENF